MTGMSGHAPGRTRRALAPGIAVAAILIGMATGFTFAAEPSGASAPPASAQAPSAPSAAADAPARVGSPAASAPRGARIQVGPTRVKLKSGTTFDGIGVIVETSRVRLIMDDDTVSEKVFDPADVEWVKAIADIEPEPEPPPKPAPAVSAKSKGAATKKGATTAKAGTGAKTVAGASTADPVTGTTSTTTRSHEPDALAEMLANAIEETERDAAHGTLGRTGEAAEGDGSAETEAAAEQAAEAAPPKGPKPEDFDATRPVRASGLRYVGPGKAPTGGPSTPPNTEFPVQAKETTDLGPAIWKPKSGFQAPSKWPSALEPGTSFSNLLSGWGSPATSLGPRWWAPKPTSWPSTLTGSSWAPSDGFAETEQRRQEFRNGSGSSGGSTETPPPAPTNP